MECTWIIDQGNPYSEEVFLLSIFLCDTIQNSVLIHNYEALYVYLQIMKYYTYIYYFKQFI